MSEQRYATTLEEVLALRSEVASLRAQLAEEKTKNALTIQHADQIGRLLASARKALEHVKAAQESLLQRTRDRMARGVEGRNVA